MERLAVTICATKSYQYAMQPQAQAVLANLRHLAHPVNVILVGDSKMKKIADLYADLFREKPDWKVETIEGFEEKDGDLNYKNDAQLLIAQMRTAAFSRARALGADLCWSLDSDVLPKTSACYRTLRWLLDMPDGYYGVAISPYPSQGGSGFLTGRGTPEHTILQDYQPEERRVPAELQKRV